MSSPQFGSLRSKDLLTIGQLSPGEIRGLFDLAAAAKADPALIAGAMAGSSVILLFEKPSLRTRVTFEVGCARMGAHGLYYDHQDDRIGARESVKDYARNLERWCQGIVSRVYKQEVLDEMARHASVPVINALSNSHHPCQALADAFTLRERFGRVEGLRVAYVGDGNNVCHSLLEIVTKLGGHATAIAPRGYEPDPSVIAACNVYAAEAGGSIAVTNRLEAVAGADAVYTDEWVSMHQKDSPQRMEAFEPYQVNEGVMAKAAGHAVFMHCLPAERGREVTDGVIDSAASVVYDQAENRLHVQNAVMLQTIGARRPRRPTASGVSATARAARGN